MIAPELRCAFCLQPRSQVAFLACSRHRFAGLPVAICRDCALSAALDMCGVPAANPREPGAAEPNRMGRLA